MSTTTGYVNHIEEIKSAKDGFDVLQDLLRLSQKGDIFAVPPDYFPLFRWFGVYRQKPNPNGFFMFRIKVPGGQLSPAQLRAIADLTEKYGRGLADITTRQDIQLHWMRMEHFQDTFETLWNVGMTSQFACGDCPRNVVSCPLSGVHPDEVIDTTALAKAISDLYIAGGREYSNLPRKFKPSIGGCPEHCYMPHIHDFGMYGVKRPDGSTGFGLLVGGGLSDSPHFGQPLRVFVQPEQVLDVSRAIARLFRDRGYREKRNHARLKFLVADKGWEWTRERIEEDLGYKLEQDETLLWPETVAGDHMGTGVQKDGHHYLGIPIARGRMTVNAMRKMADLSERYALGEKRIRLTLRQNVILLDVPAGNVAKVADELAHIGLPTGAGAHALRTSLIACTGTQFCNLAVVETKARAGRVLKWLEENTSVDVPVSISFTGCPNACAQFQVCDIGLTGTFCVDPLRKDENGKPLRTEGYNVFLGGNIGSDPKFGERIAKQVVAERVHLALKNLLDHYMEERIDEDERFSTWTARSEPEYLKKLITEPTVTAGAEVLMV